MKVKLGECCDTFESYTISIEVENVEDHIALHYLSLCNSKVPQALYDKATAMSASKYASKAQMIRTRSKSFLLSLAAAIPVRKEYL